MATTTTPHILVFPYPAQGHMLPLLDLTHHLALRGATITIVITPKNLPFLDQLLSTHPTSIHTLVLPFPTHPSIPSGVENVKDLPIQAFKPMMRALSQLQNPILHWAQSHPSPSPPTAILSDLFLGWTQSLASLLRIPRIVFSPCSALAVSIMHSLWRNLPQNNSLSITFPEIPTSPAFPFSHLSTVYRSYIAGDPDSEFIREGMLANIVSWGIVFNSFTELDSVWLDYLKRDLCHDRVWAVGPLLPPPVNDSAQQIERGGSSSVNTDELLAWLDSCPDHSVVYVCFGSQAVLANAQTEALANGLEKSGTRFVWCVKEPTKGYEEGEFGSVPGGFEDRVKKGRRGVVIRGWAPQVMILSHRAVGAFLTHCGWNSVLESVVAGVPMLSWPMGADQYPNATMLVEQLGVAVRVCEGAMTVPEADKLARVVAESVSESAESRRKRASELRDSAVGAVREGGSSYRDLDRLVMDLSQLNSVETLVDDEEKK